MVVTREIYRALEQNPNLILLYCKCGKEPRVLVDEVMDGALACSICRTALVRRRDLDTW